MREINNQRPLKKNPAAKGRKRSATEQALYEATERLNLALYAASMGTWSWHIADASATSIWDEHMWPLFGLPARNKPTVMPHEDFLACIHTADRETVKHEVFYEVMEKGFYHIEYRVVWPDGSIHWIAERAKLYRDETGQPLSVTGVCFDITERKQSEQALLQMTERLHLALEAGKVGTWYWDIGSDEAIWDKYTAALMGFNQGKEMRTNHAGFIACVHPDDRKNEMIKQDSVDYIKDNKPFYFEYRVVWPDGSVHTIAERGKLFRDQFGNPLRVSGVCQDVTERIEAEAHLKKLNERLSLALDAAVVGTWWWDIKTDKLSWDDHIKKLFALTDDVYDSGFGDFLEYVHADDRNIISIKTQRAIKGKEDQVEFEHRLIWPDGSIHVIATRGKIYRDENGQAIRMAGASCDVTDRRRAEQRLRDSEEKYRSIVETTNEWIWEMDTQRRLTYNNPALFRVLGYRPSELLGRPCESVLHDDDREAFLNSLVLHTQAKTGWSNEVFRWRHKDGSYRYLESSAVPVMADNGGLKGFRGADRDITHRRRVEQALEELTERLNLALRAASMGTWSWSIPDNVINWDDYMYPLYGVPQQSNFNGGYEKVMALIYPDDREYVQQEVQKAMRDKLSFDIEHRVQWSDGSIHFIAVRGKIYCNDQGEAVRLTGLSWDVTPRKQAEQLGRQHQIELAHVARMNSLGEMASTLAHELNQPLAAIANYTKGCVRRLETGNFQLEQVLHAMQQAAVQSERAGEIIHRMKNFVRKGKLYYEAADINEIIREMAKLINYEMREFPVNIQLELTNHIPHLSIDRVQIEQVLLNLLRNAVEAMQDAKIAKPTLIVRTLMPGLDIMHVDVIDNGPGFSAEIGQHLLTPYFTTKPKGMGMGLAICRTIIEAHGGHLSARLNPPGGAWFQFTLPINNLEII